MARQGAAMPKPLRLASRDLESWRKQRSGRRIPETLWARATRLARRYGVSRTAKALGLDYVGLKSRAGQSVAREPQARPAFIEVTPDSVLKSSCVVEIEYAHGVKMRVQFEGGHPQTLAMLRPVIWRAEA